MKAPAFSPTAATLAIGVDGGAPTDLLLWAPDGSAAETAPGYAPGMGAVAK